MEPREPVPDNLRSLIEDEKASEGPSSDARERVLLRLAGTFAIGATGGLPPADTSPGAPGNPTLPTLPSSPTSPAVHVIHAARWAPAVRAALLFATGAATGAGGYHVVERARRPAPPPVVAPAARSQKPSAPEAPGPAPSPAPPPAPDTAGTPIRPRAGNAAPSAPGSADRPDDPLAAERSVLEMARAALGRGQAERALAALRRHAREFPNGELTEEREGLLVQALVAAQKYDPAREKAAQFKKRYPRSLFAPVVDQAIGSIP